MIDFLQVENFRILSSNYVSLRPMQMLVGQNGTGKTTFMQAIVLLSQIQADTGILPALESLSPSLLDLFCDRERPMSFAAEFLVPVAGSEPARLRYEVELGIHPERRAGIQVLRENLFSLPAWPQDGGRGRSGPLLSPTVHDHPPPAWTRLVTKTRTGDDRYLDTEGNVAAFRLKPTRTALSAVYEDPERYGLALAVLRFLRDGIRLVALSPEALRQPSEPGKGNELAPSGANLPAALSHLRKRDPVLFDHWRRQVSLAIKGLCGVDLVEQPENKKLLLRARFEGAHEEPVPSYLLSEGTLRVMALCLLSLLPSPEEPVLYLIEEVENGLHPLAMQAVYEALARPPDDVQIFCSTHSPILLGHGDLDQMLLFRRKDDGTAAICHGDEDEDLKAWLQRASLVDLFARGVLA